MRFNGNGMLDVGDHKDNKVARTIGRLSERTRLDEALMGKGEKITLLAKKYVSTEKRLLPII